MTLVITHSYVSARPVGTTSTRIYSDSWNANHQLTGTVDASQLNANVVQAIVNDTNVTGTIAAQTLTFGWSGTLAAARLNSNVVQAITNDTNVTGTIAAQNLTLAWTGQLGLSRGGLNADLSATGGAANYLKQASVGAAITVGTIPASDIASGTALTKVDDTNVTLTLGGTPTTALLKATSLTLGWTGTLSIARGGTGQGTQQAAFDALAPTATRAGDLTYWNGTHYVNLAGNNSGTKVLQEDASGVPSWVTVTGTGTVTSITPGNGLTSTLTATGPGSAITSSGTLSIDELINAQSGTTYAIVDGDRGKLITATNAASQAYSIAQAGAASAFQAGWFTDIQNNSTNVAGIITVTPATSTINGAATLKIQPGQFARIVSDGANYQVWASPNAKQVPGTATNDSANAGNVGEYISSTVLVGSAIGLTTATPISITSVSLTAGDWDVEGAAWINPAGTITFCEVGTSSTNNTLPTRPLSQSNGTLASTSQVGLTAPFQRYSLSGTTTVYIVLSPSFTSTATGYGYIAARRVR